MKRVVFGVAVVGGAALAVVVAAVLAGGAETSSGPAVEITWDELDLHVGQRVRLAGTAHYEAVVRQEKPASLVREAEVVWLYGFFPPYETDSRAVRVLVRSPEQPERNVNYEQMTVEGTLVVSGPDLVPYDTEVLLAKGTEYYFAEGVLVLDDVTFPAPAP
jgi:hypothetical protein